MCFSGIGLRPAWVSLAFEFLWNGKRMVLAGAMHGFLWHATSRWHSPTRGQDGQWMLVAGEIMNPNLLISSLIKCMFLKDLKVVFWYIFDTVSRLTRRDSHLSLQLICAPVDLWKLGLGAPGLLVSFAQTREEEIASTLRTNRISETWYDMTTKNNNITKLWESCLPILGPSPDCVRDAHVRWISTATTSNGLDKRLVE